MNMNDDYVRSLIEALPKHRLGLWETKTGHPTQIQIRFLLKKVLELCRFKMFAQ
jgi:hypothetical protein